MRQFPGAQAAWLVGVTAGGAASSAGATLGAGDDTTAAVRVDLTGATARRGALRRTAARGAVAARGGARRRAVRFRAVLCAVAARLGLRTGFAGALFYGTERSSREEMLYETNFGGCSNGTRRIGLQALRLDTGHPSLICPAVYS